MPIRSNELCVMTMPSHSELAIFAVSLFRCCFVKSSLVATSSFAFG